MRHAAPRCVGYEQERKARDHAAESWGQADFNGDQKSDLWCYEPSNGYVWVALTNDQGTAVAPFGGTDWTRYWCAIPGATIGTADFDADGRADFWCHDHPTGTTYVTVSTGHDFYSRGALMTGWCSHGGATFGTADFNGDAHADLWCHDPMGTGSNGNTWVALGRDILP